MDQGYKHFSHLHNLIMHQMPEGIEVSCSGCHSSATGTVYVCWQCNFFLHDQCYRATRSLKHPSHPLHPLTLVPYPTYHSNSFYCNSCQIIGTGFSYSCADCEFDLHVQCAYSISRATSFKNAHHFQELVPQGWNGVPNSNIDHHVQFSSVPESLPIPFTGAQNHYIPPSSVSSHDYNLASVSIPTNYPPNTIHGVKDPPMPQNRPSASFPTSSQNLISNAQYPSMAQTLPSDSIHTSYPTNTIPNSEAPPMPQDGPSVFIPTGSQNRISSVQYPSIDQIEPSVSIPTDYPQIPIPSAQDPSTSQNKPVSISTSSYNSSGQAPSLAQTGPSVSMPTDYPQNPVPFVQDPSTSQNRPVSVPTSSCNSSAQYASLAQTGPSVSITTDYSQNPIPSAPDSSTSQNKPVSFPTSSYNSSAQHASLAQSGPSVSIPTDYPQNPIPSAQDSSMSQNKPVSIPTSSYSSSAQHASLAQTGPSVSIPTNYPQNPIPSAQDHSTSQNKPVSIPTSSYNSSAQHASVAQSGHSVSIPTGYPQNPIPSAQDPSMPQNTPSVSIPTSSHNSSAQYPSVAQDGPSVSIPTNPSDHSKPQNGLKDKDVMHFSHSHKLCRVTLQEDEENEVICSGCQETLVGNGYSCVEPDCDFHLHESCFHLKKEIHHKSHPKHPLTLLPKAPYNKDGEFTCNACSSDGTGFVYHCSVCTFDLHIPCVSLPETVKRADHKHILKLFYSCPVKDEDYTYYCDVCHVEVQKDRWVYYCEPCDYITHLGCVDCEECERDSILDTQAQLQRLEFQMQMARQNAQLLASLGASLSSLVG